jgi:mRNA interferase RelE/StbE
MIIKIDKSFVKDTDKIVDKNLLISIADCIKNIRGFNKLSEIPNCKKLKGSKNAYRIRIGNYRIGFVFENRTIEFVRFLHRDKIYDSFPD